MPGARFCCSPAAGSTACHPSPGGARARCIPVPHRPGRDHTSRGVRGARRASPPWLSSPGKDGTNGGEGGGGVGMRPSSRVRIQPGQALRARLWACSPCPGTGRAFADAPAPLIQALHMNWCLPTAVLVWAWLPCTGCPGCWLWLWACHGCLGSCSRLEVPGQEGSVINC